MVTHSLRANGRIFLHGCAASGQGSFGHKVFDGDGASCCMIGQGLFYCFVGTANFADIAKVILSRLVKTKPCTVPEYQSRVAFFAFHAHQKSGG